MKVNATVFKGLGVASKTIKIQMGMYPKEIRELLSEIKIGTINLNLEVPVMISNWDHVTERIQWTNSWPAETFRLKQCLISTATQKNMFCWVYRSSLSPHNVDPFRMEILAVPITGVESNAKVQLEFLGAEYIQTIHV